VSEQNGSVTGYSCQDRTLVVVVPNELFNAPDTICEFRAPIASAGMATRHPGV
jgi:hypothetical protein